MRSSIQSSKLNGNLSEIIPERIALLRRRDPRLNQLFDGMAPEDLTLPKWLNVSDAVVFVVIGQMLSSQAATAILNRLRLRLGSSADIISWADKNSRRSGPILGVSHKKRRALSAWVQHMRINGDIWRRWPHMSLAALTEDVCSIWGFGPWSADMLAIFYLGRLDVWPSGDIAIQRACRLVLGTDNPEQFLKIAAGSETIIALALWHHLDSIGK